MKFFLTLLCLLPFAIFADAAAPLEIRDEIRWPEFLARHDLVWENLPSAWHEGAFIGNGLLGAMIYRRDDEALRLDVGRSDVGWRGNRIAIGRFELVPGEKIRRGQMRLDLWNAEARGSINGKLSWRAFTHAEQLINAVEVEGTPSFVFIHEPVVDARKFYKKEPIPQKDRQPDPRFDSADGVSWCAQSFQEGGGYVVAWGQRDQPNGRRMFVWTVDYDEAAAPVPSRAAERVQRALAQGMETLAASHRAWWHAWWPKSFLSVPDTRLESFYWIQMYKLGSATRADRPAIDLMGPWFRTTPWPRIWWNLNIQLTYWPVYAANRLDIGESLTRMLDRGVSNLVLNVPAEMQSDSAGIGRTSWYDCRGQAGRELGNLTWALHNYWLQYRYSGNETMLREQLFPLLKRAATYLIRHLKPGDDGRLHFPDDISPEYPQTAPDTNYNLALLRWALTTLIATDARLKLNDPASPRWRETLSLLAPCPVDDKTGYMIGRGVPLTQSHRHFSHLLMFYPLHLEDPDSPSARPLLEKSLDHWIHFEGALQGYSFTGASAMSSWLRRRGPNVELLGQFLDRFVKPNTMYLEAGPVIETPLAGAAAVHEIVLQSWSIEPFGTRIRPFPAVPDVWRDATIHNMLAEGAFLVSAARREGRTRWVRVTSLAGNPCRVETGLEGPVAASGARPFAVTTEPDSNGRMITTVDLRKGESVLLYPVQQPPSRDDLAVAAVAPQPDRLNWFGSRKTPPIKARTDGSFVLEATTAALHGEKFVINRRGQTPNIGGWMKEDGWISWNVRIEKPTTFRVRLVYATPRDTTKLRLALEKDGEPIACADVTLPKTGSYETFRETDAGTLVVGTAGDCLFTVRSGDGRAPLVNIERVDLSPARQ